MKKQVKNRHKMWMKFGICRLCSFEHFEEQKSVSFARRQMMGASSGPIFPF
jgi:hypothetical protein